MSRKILLLGIATLLAAGSCADNRASFFIMLVPVPQEGCSLEDSEEVEYRTNGYWDLALADSYYLGMLLQNQLTPVGSPDDFVAETNGIQVEGANIRIFRGVLARGAEEWKGYVAAASYVPPQDTTPMAILIPSDAHRALSALRDDPYVESQLESSAGFPVTIGVTVIGQTNGNTDVETPEFFFTIMLSYATRIYCFEDLDTGEICPFSDSIELVGCNPGEDAIMSCQVCWYTEDPDGCMEPCM